MIKQLLFGLWIAGITLAGTYAGQSMAVAGGSGDKAAAAVRTNVFKTDLVAFPYIGEAGLVGYLMTRFTFRIDANLEKKLAIPMDMVIYHAMNGHFFAEAGKLATPRGWSDLRQSLDSLRDAANDVAGKKLVVDVLVEQLDFFDKDQVRVPAVVRFEEEL
ncbi:hypothetical protein [Oricola sp.]|uniref:hypothetical protein n=1 Tax=Oricola sp. TaxID=1979950 RepID=UPI003BAB2987